MLYRRLISLALGDPTALGNLTPPPEAVKAIQEAIGSGRYNGYGPSQGAPAARQAVACHVSVPGGQVEAEDVILCSGCSGALDMAIFTLADAGQNILVPRPGFPLYITLAAGYGTKNDHKQQICTHSIVRVVLWRQDIETAIQYCFGSPVT